MVYTLECTYSGVYPGGVYPDVHRVVYVPGYASLPTYHGVHLPIPPWVHLSCTPSGMLSVLHDSGSRGDGALGSKRRNSLGMRSREAPFSQRCERLKTVLRRILPSFPGD